IPRNPIIFLSVVANVLSFCELSKANTWTDRTFAHIVNNRYELLLTDRLKTRQNLHMLCGGREGIFSTICQSNGKFNPPLPRTNCSVAPLAPSVERVDDSSCPHTMYSVGFRFQGSFLEIYRRCYDADTVTAHFSIGKVYPTYLNADRQANHFDRDNIISPADAASFQQRNIYNRFRTLLGPGQSYVTTPLSLSFDRGHLTPAAQYTFSRNLQQTNKYINVVPQHYQINRGNWRTVENWIDRLLSEGLYDVLKVCTGALGVLELEDTEIYLAPHKNPVPKWTYKIVSHLSGDRFVILTYNNGWATEAPDTSSVCHVVRCPDSLRPRGTGYTYCCHPSHFIR
ncbi:hypothetical protein KR032_000601, partial [Drosophila birchii]